MTYQPFLTNGLIVDNFAGGGGASTAIEMALGRPVNIAVNHDADALGMHEANHPLTKHYCENIWDIDVRTVCNGRQVDLAWFSPDCKHFSKAKGGKPVEKKIRGLAWVVLRWAAVAKPTIIFLENVEEFITWGPLLSDGRPDPRQKSRTFHCFVNALRRQGYTNIEWRESRACHYGAPTIRKRLLLIARCDGLPIVWPEKTHEDPKKIPKGSKLKPWKTAADCIDWSVPCPSIFSRPKPLAENTLKRIGKGMKKFVIEAERPFIVRTAHSDVGKNGSKRWGKGEHSIDEPLPTATSAGDMAVVTPYLTECANATSQRVFSADEPLRTQCAEVKGGHFAVISPTLIEVGYGEAPGQAPRAPGLDKPLGTVVAGAGKHAIVAAHMQRMFGTGIGHPLDEPSRACTSKEKSAICTGYLVGAGGPAYSGKPTALDVPMGTLVTENHKGLVTAFLVKHFGGVTGVDLRTPFPTITSIPNQNQIAAAYVSKMRGTNIGHGMDSPLHTITCSGKHHAQVNAFLVKYFGTDQDPQLLEPLHTVTTKDRFALVQVESTATDNLTEEQRYNAWWTIRFLEKYQAIPTIDLPDSPRPSFLMLGDYIMYDIGMRMMIPRELFTAQGFPKDYIITHTAKGKPLTKTAQVKMCGNSVSPLWAKAHIKANVEQPAIIRGRAVA